MAQQKWMSTLGGQREWEMGPSPDKCLWRDLGRSLLKAGLGSVCCSTKA